jgi:hypothetical protein
MAAQPRRIIKFFICVVFPEQAMSFLVQESKASCRDAPDVSPQSVIFIFPRATITLLQGDAITFIGFTPQTIN